MRSLPVLVVALLATPLLAQDAAPKDWHPVAPGANWSITDSTCAIDASWDGDIGVVLSLHDDHHDLGIYNPHFTGVVDDKVVMLRYGAGGPPAQALTNEALGHRDAKSVSYVADIHGDALLNGVAASHSFQLYRAGATLVDLDMTGFDAALKAMRSCEVASAAKAAADAADAAANAADAADNMTPDNAM